MTRPATRRAEAPSAAAPLAGGVGHLVEGVARRATEASETVETPTRIARNTTTTAPVDTATAAPVDTATTGPVDSATAEVGPAAAMGPPGTPAPTRIHRRMEAGTVAGPGDPMAHAGLVIRRWEWWDRRQKARAEAAKAAAAKKAEQQAGSAAAKEAAADQERRTYKGKAGQLPTAAVEAGKPGGALAASAAGGAAMSAVAGTSAGVGGLSVLQPLLLGDAALGMYNASAMQDEGARFGDQALTKLGSRKMGDQSAAFGTAATGAAKAGVDLGRELTDAAATGTLGVAGAGLGIAVGGAQVLQGAWRGGKAVMALCRLTWGRGQQMLTHEGDRWKAAVTAAEQFKVATNAMKIAVGALGIAAGALFIVSNPIGWAVGIAAGIAGGIYAISKIAAKVSNARDRDKVAEQLKTKSADRVGAELGVPVAPAAKGGKAPTGKGFAADKQASNDPQARDRQRVIDQANQVARLAGENARIAAEMREAMSHGDKDLVFKSLEIVAREGPEPESMGPFAARVPANLFDMIRQAESRRLHDAFQILTAINVDPDHALSPSGQDLIEKKLSKAESM